MTPGTHMSEQLHAELVAAGWVPPGPETLQARAAALRAAADLVSNLCPDPEEMASPYAEAVIDAVALLEGMAEHDTALAA